MIHSINKGSLHRWMLVAGVVMVAGLSGLPAAYAGEDAAMVAIARAEAKIDLISRETPAATHNPSFSVAHDKLTQARDAAEHHKNQKAEWLANEAELLADNTAGSAKLAELEASRAQISHDVDILELELRK
jgi:hypothetical protein